MTQVTDAAALNGLTLSSKYFYNAQNQGAGVARVNGVVSYSGTVTSTGQASLSGKITDNGNGFFTITDSSGSSVQYQVLGSTADGNNLVFEPAAGNGVGSNQGPYFILANAGANPSGNLDYASGNNYQQPTCFLRGTMILTESGEVPVEALRVGDRVVTASGEAQPVRWIGRQSYDCPTYIRPTDVMPIRVAEGAFAPNMLTRDTFMSPGHAIVIPTASFAVVPVGLLSNGKTVAQVPAGVVEYWHFELDRHDAVYANGLLVETYLESGNRNSFATVAVADGFILVKGQGDDTSPYERHDRSALVEEFRERLAERAMRLSFCKEVAQAA